MDYAKQLRDTSLADVSIWRCRMDMLTQNEVFTAVEIQQTSTMESNAVSGWACVKVDRNSYTNVRMGFGGRQLATCGVGTWRWRVV